MISKLATAMLVASLCLPCVTVNAETAITFKSVSVTLPDGPSTFPKGSAADTVTTNCTACHSAEMILTQPMLSKAAWGAEVAKMRNVYKAPVDDKDVDSIVNYLTEVKGTP